MITRIFLPQYEIINNQDDGTSGGAYNWDPLDCKFDSR